MQPTHWQTAYRMIREDRAVHFPVKSALQGAMDRDPVDAYFDALLVAKVLKARMQELNGDDGLVHFDETPTELRAVTA